MRPLFYLAICCFPLLLIGCSGAPTHSDSIDSSSRASLEEILAADSVLEARNGAEVPQEINSQVQNWIDYFSQRDRDRFSQFLRRGQYYRELISGLLQEQGVPIDLFYLAMIESGFVMHARSRAKAVGPWQFIRSTGRQYGLRADSTIDERRDVVRSTRAAARLLKDLRQEFGSWYLAMAAYNAGEGRIRGAIRKGGSRDFWTLASKSVLPRETVNYVPKYLAAMIICRNPLKYGFKVPPGEQYPAVQPLDLPGGASLADAARKTGIPVKEIELLNPHLLHGRIPLDVKNYRVWIPRDKIALADELRRELSPDRKPASR